uniref:Uncharacterized protein n=1 Tax=Panagrolaimus davidi TaxID=227884 RepID=A0A914Q257_9BILA
MDCVWLKNFYGVVGLRTAGDCPGYILLFKGTTFMKKNVNDDSLKPTQSSQEAEISNEKSKSQSMQIVSKENKSIKKDPEKIHVDGKTAAVEEKDGGNVNQKIETSQQKCQSKSKNLIGKDKLGQSNKDGYDNLNTKKKQNEEAKSKMKTNETNLKLKPKDNNKDDGNDAIDLTKNVNLENVNINESNDDKVPSPINKRNKSRQRRRRRPRFRQVDEDDTLYEIGGVMPTVDFTIEYYERQKKSAETLSK